MSNKKYCSSYGQKIDNYNKLPIVEPNEMSKNKKLNNILKTEKTRVFRKAVLSDFIKDTSIQNLDIPNPNSNKIKTKKYRIQGEFGEKKFIKP